MCLCGLWPEEPVDRRKSGLRHDVITNADTLSAPRLPPKTPPMIDNQ